MMSINAENTRNLPIGAVPRADKPWKKRVDAKAAAVSAIGPHAREGFEFDTTKCDGGWRWKATDEVRPDTAAQIRANGGKRASKTPQVPAMPGMTPLGIAKKAPTEPAHAPEPPKATEQPAAPKTAQAPPAGEVSADPLDIPPFLKRGGKLTPAEHDALIAKHKRTTGPDRKIKNPPNVKAAKSSKGKAGKLGGAKTTKAAMVGQLLLDPKGCTTADILKATGWPSVSVPAQAKAVGLKLRKEKKPGEVTRYFGVPTK